VPNELNLPLEGELDGKFVDYPQLWGNIGGYDGMQKHPFNDNHTTDKFYQDIQPDGTGGQVWQLL